MNNNKPFTLIPVAFPGLNPADRIIFDASAAVCVVRGQDVAAESIAARKRKSNPLGILRFSLSARSQV